MSRMRRTVLGAVLGLSLLSTDLRGQPRPGSPAASAAAFPIRGIKGLWWDGLDNYRKALPWVADHGENFLMLCYTSFPASGKDWRASYTDAELKGLGELAREADARGVELCLSFNPGIWSKPPLVYASDKDFQIALDKVKAVHARGIRSFSLCLDDIGRKLEPADVEKYGRLGKAQADFTNRLWAEMKRMDPTVRLIFCPSAYTTEDARKHPEYMADIRQIDPGVGMFWTGVQVCSPTITAADAREYGAMVGRKPIVWDNYPVNDMFPWRPLMGPVKGRSADLPNEVAGFMSNPMKQWEASKIPLATVADYLRDPAGYDPKASIERVFEGYPADERDAVKLLAGLYGRTFWGEQGWPPRPAVKVKAAAQAQVPQYAMLEDLMSKAPGLQALWDDVKPTVADDLRALRRTAEGREKSSPLSARGDDFEGGGGERYGYDHDGRHVNFVYAAPTGLSRMRVKFWTTTAGPGTLNLVGRSDDRGNRPKIKVTVNGQVAYEGPSPFGQAFEAKAFPVKTLRAGENALVIENAEEQGTAGMPPWLMVSDAELKVGPG